MGFTHLLVSAVDPTDKPAPTLTLGFHGPVGLEILETTYTDGVTPAKDTRFAMTGIGVYYENCMAEHMSAPLKGPVQTNNRAELTAGLRALKEFEKMSSIITYSNQRFRLCTDSAVLLTGLCGEVEHGEVEQWYRRGWRSTKNKSIMNADIWRGILKVWRRIDEVVIPRKVKAHSGVEGNENADKLTVLGVYLQEEQRATGARRTTTSTNQ